MKGRVIAVKGRFIAVKGRVIAVKGGLKGRPVLRIGGSDRLKGKGSR